MPENARFWWAGTTPSGPIRPSKLLKLTRLLATAGFQRFTVEMAPDWHRRFCKTDSPAIAAHFRTFGEIVHGPHAAFACWLRSYCCLQGFRRRGRWVSHWGEVASVIGEVASVIDVRAPANLLGEKRRASDRSSFANASRLIPVKSFCDPVAPASEFPFAVSRARMRSQLAFRAKSILPSRDTLASSAAFS
jgi:hypothetical protein